MMSKKVYIETYGCQMNVADTEVIFSLLEKHGYERTEDLAQAVPFPEKAAPLGAGRHSGLYGRKA